MPASSRGGRGGASAAALKFKPKSATRRSKEEREADEKAEAAKIKREQDVVDRERMRAEKRAERGRGNRERGRGGSTMLGGGMSHLTGAISGTSGSRSGGSGWGDGGGGGGGGGRGGGGGQSGRSGGGGGGGGGGNGGRVKGNDSGAGIVGQDHGGRKLINIEDIATVNLISDDETEDANDKAKTKLKQGLAPIRVTRHEHIPRRMKVNIDLDTLPDEDKEAARAVISGDVGGTGTMQAVPIKIEDDEAPVPGAVKIKRESDIQDATQAKKTRSRVNKGTAAVPTTIDLDDKPIAPSQMPQQGPPIGGGAVIAVPRPLYVPDSCNFLPQPRPPGWDSKEDAANWDRNVHKSWLVYSTLADPRKAKRDANAQTETPKETATAGEDTEMKDSKLDEVIEEELKQARDNREGLVYLFQVPPNIPGVEDLKSKADIDRENEELQIIEQTADSSTYTKAAEGSRKGKGKQPAATAEPKIKQEPIVKEEPTEEVPAEKEASSSQSDSASKPGYIGDLVVYNTGEATLDWGGLPLRIRAGMQADMLQHVLLTSAPVTKELAEEGDKVKKEPGAPVTNDANSKAHCLGVIGGQFTCIPDFNQFFGDKWKWYC